MANVRRHALDTRGLLTVGPSSAVWSHDGEYLPSFPAGTLIRLFPPANATPEHIERVRAALIEMGARAVRLMPRGAKAAPIRGSVKLESPRPRDCVMAMAIEAPEELRADLRNLLAEILDRVQL